MTQIPNEVEALLRARDEARAAKNYATADQIRDQVDALGYEIRDAPGGATAQPKPSFTRVDPDAVGDALDREPSKTISIHVLYEGYRDDLTRFVDAIAKHCGAHDYEIVVTDAAHDDAEWLETLRSERVRMLHLSKDQGWATSRTAALKTSEGRLVAIADLSVEATGDLLGPLIKAFDDPKAGVAGPWGITTKNLRDFDADEGPRVDAIEGYFLATRRDLLKQALPDDRFRWYRHADIEYSFRIRDLGYDAVVTDPAATRHTHRAWAALEGNPEERDNQSRKNFNLFLGSFRSRDDLLVRDTD